MEHIIHSTVMKHLDMHDILIDAQHGFRKSRSCESQPIMTAQDLADNLNRNKQVDGILLDFSKAFDKVPHQRLLDKLNYYGVRGNLHSWIKDFLTNRKQEVVLEGNTLQDRRLHLVYPKEPCWAHVSSLSSSTI